VDVFTAAAKARGIALTGAEDLSNYHYTPEDSRFVKTLLDVYENYTGQKGECIAIGGGTYVHNINGGVAFGCVMPGYDTHMHGDNERIALDDLVLSGKMFAQTIIELCL
jgi:succinyl-diaminopimelate desuccinylase